MADMRLEAVMGVITPERGEARLVTRWPSVAAFSGPARLGSAIQETAHNLLRWAIDQHPLLTCVLLIVILPIATAMGFAAWAILAPFYFSKVLPIIGTRYGLTNKRLMIQKGITAQPVQEVTLKDIDEVRIIPGSEQPFYLAADLEVISKGKPAMTLKGVREYASFLVSIRNARNAWGRVQPTEQAQPASAMGK